MKIVHQYFILFNITNSNNYEITDCVNQATHYLKI